MKKLTIAVPTGRLKDEALVLLGRMPHCPCLSIDSRKLVIEEASSPWRVLLTHPKDVSTYVEYGVADLGIVGKDIILERGNEIYELLDLRIGKCVMVLAAPEGVTPETFWEKGRIRIATKYPNFTRHFLQERGVAAEVLFLYGSIELAPNIGLADAIVDLVSTGKTLRENHLKVLEEIVPISGRLAVNRISIKTKGREIQEFVEEIKGVIDGEPNPPQTHH